MNTLQPELPVEFIGPRASRRWFRIFRNRVIQESNFNTDPKRRRVWKLTGDRCVYCGEKTPAALRTLHKIIPPSQGGTSRFENLIPACLECANKRDPNLWASVDVHPDFADMVKQRELAIRYDTGEPEVIKARSIQTLNVKV